MVDLSKLYIHQCQTISRAELISYRRSAIINMYMEIMFVLNPMKPSLHEPYSRHYLSMLLAAEPLAWHMTFNAFVCILDRG